MTWEEAVISIRSKLEFQALVKDTYIDSDLVLNVKRYGESEEFEEILHLLKDRKGSELVDIGSGNGISAINFALNGFNVTAVEPDESNTIGFGAIIQLKEQYKLPYLKVCNKYGEATDLDDKSFDIYFARQAMHHAIDLSKFVKEAYHLLKPGGIFLTVRDHIIYNELDKNWFLQNHPLHHLYGGENGYTLEQYTNAIESSGLEIIRILDHFSSPINYHPIMKRELEDLPKRRELELREHFRSKVGRVGSWNLLFALYKNYVGFSTDKVLDEKHVPGRMYSFLARKPE